MKRSWKVYGANGHRQKESFNESYKYDFSSPDKTRIIEVENSDVTGTNDYTIIRITRDSFEECKEELNGQLSDGVFENVRTGEIEEITEYIKYEVDYFDPENGATSPIDTIEEPIGYTAENYIEDCMHNADDQYCEMLSRGKVTLIALC